MKKRNVGIARCESEMAIMQGSCPKCNAKWAIQDWVNAKFVCPTCAHQLIPGSIIGVHSPTGRILTPCTMQRAQREVEAGRAQWNDDRVIRLVGSLVKRRDYRAVVFLRDGGLCVWCGLPADTLDHIIPNSHRGRYHPVNLMPACARCNGERQNRTTGDYIRYLQRENRPPARLEMIQTRELEARLAH